MAHLCSECLKIERKRLKLTQQALALSIDVSDMTIKRWETGTPIPSDKLSLLATLGFDVLYILTGQRSMPVALNPKEEALLDNYRNSNEAGKKAVETTASAFANADTNKKAANGG